MELKKGYKQTDIGVIPDDWEVVNLNSIGNFKNGINKNKEDFGFGFPFVNLMDVFDKSSLNSNENFDLINSSKYERELYNLTKGDILFIRSSVKPSGVGLASVVLEDIENTIFSGFLIRFRLEKEINHNFKKYCFFEENFRKRLISNSTVSANTNINQEKLKSLLLVLPTIEEQKAIANVLSDTDQLIQNLKTLIAKKKAIKQGAMQELLTGKKRLQGFTEKWETKKLGEVAFIKTGSKNNQDKVSDGNFPFFVRSQSVERINTYSYDCEAILVPGEGGIGSIFHYINGKFDVHQRVYVINDFSQNVFGKYVYLFMKEHFGTHAMKNSVKATVDSLRLPTFQEFEIKIPKDIQEQQAIAQILSDMDAEIEALEQQLQKTQALKQGMMQELLTGKTRLVKPAIQEEPKPLAMVAEPEVVYKSNEGHNWEFNEAVIISAMVDKFGSEKYPLGRKRYTKLCYLMHRYKEEEVKGYLKKAAGPYNPATKYKGPEKIAQKNKYIKKKKAGKYAGFVVDECIIKANAYFKKWYGQNVLNWLEQFRFQSNDTLELWATVDMAIEDLKQENKPVNFQTIKELINNHEEWRPKLKRPVFSDDNIKTAINKINQLFG